MRVITDRPEFAERLLGRAGPWMPVDPGDLDPEDRALATALLDGSRHLAWAEDEEPGWDRLFVAGRATRSQFDALAGLAESGSASGPLLAAAAAVDGFHGRGGPPRTAVPGPLHPAPRPCEPA